MLELQNKHYMRLQNRKIKSSMNNNTAVTLTTDEM